MWKVPLGVLPCSEQCLSRPPQGPLTVPTPVTLAWRVSHLDTRAGDVPCASKVKKPELGHLGSMMDGFSWEEGSSYLNLFLRPTVDFLALFVIHLWLMLLSALSIMRSPYLHTAENILQDFSNSS